MTPLPTTGPLPRPTTLTQAANALKTERIPNPGVNTVTLTTHEFTSVCPRTHQPDYCTITIDYTPSAWCIESKSLKHYLWAYREHPAFTEAVARQIHNDIQDAISPNAITVTVTQNARGGITLTATARTP